MELYNVLAVSTVKISIEHVINLQVVCAKLHLQVYLIMVHCHWYIKVYNIGGEIIIELKFEYSSKTGYICTVKVL